VLDIGCGWGGMALHLAKQAGVNVTGVTLSTEQLAVAEQRALAPSVNARVRFELCDYREVSGLFDRIVSVGMFEHVGLAGFDGYFQTVAERLKDDGVALIHTIGRRGKTGGRSAWLNKYIFPGGYIPSLSEITDAVEKSGLFITDIEPLRLHYAETLRHWRERFLAHRAEIAALYDERFCRMWEFYLCWCELGFRYGDLMVFQVQLAKRLDTLPITRDYMMPQASARVAEEAAGETLKGIARAGQAIRQGEAG
jgi:cyclopropane-fatty-acyl-phospholipid synthase